VVPHYITEVFYANLTEDQTYVVLFLCELLMLRDCSIFFGKEKIEKVIQLVDQVQSNKLAVEDSLHKEIKETIILKEAKIIVKKYEPKFDMERFMNAFLE
jgi:hypothetical protein